MAVPESATTLNLSGRYKLNKALSHDVDVILQRRDKDIDPKTRAAIKTADAYVTIKHYKDASGVEHFDLKDESPGVAAVTLERTLDGNEWELAHALSGPVKGRSLRVKPQDLQVSFLKDGWLPSVGRDGAIQISAKSDTGKTGKSWRQDSIFGLEEIDGSKRHTRRVHIHNSEGEDIHAIFVYDYLGN